MQALEKYPAFDRELEIAPRSASIQFAIESGSYGHSEAVLVIYNPVNNRISQSIKAFDLRDESIHFDISSFDFSKYKYWPALLKIDGCNIQSIRIKVAGSKEVISAEVKNDECVSEEREPHICKQCLELTWSCGCKPTNIADEIMSNT